MKSFSEIDTTVKRAVRAGGFPWGIAEEVGKNIKLLEMFGLPGVKNINAYLKIYKKNIFEKINKFEKSNKSKKYFCPIISGTNFMDQSTIIQELKELEIKNMSFPVLLLPFLSRSSEIVGKRIFLKLDNKEFLLNFNQSIYSNYLSGEVVEIAEHIDIKFLDNKDTFSEEEWKNLYALSENTFVEETDNLKNTAAGAGLTDND
tara:strand:- start:1958 stop:2566 length:609 start_codon:yes stop_codon:yes gene_type:complete